MAEESPRSRPPTRNREPLPRPTEVTTLAGESPVERAFRLLQVVVAAGESIGVRELGRRTGLPRSTVSRLIRTLADLGMVSRTSDGAVLPGSALATLHPSAASAPLLEDQLRPLLAELVQVFGENAALSIDDGDRLLYLTQVSADHAVSVPAVISERHHFHLVAPGLVTMAWWSPDRLADHLGTDLEAATGHSVIATDLLRERVTQIRTAGWCWTNQELDIGVNGVAVPVLGKAGELIATISLFGPAYRLNPDARPRLALDLAAMICHRSPTLLL